MTADGEAAARPLDAADFAALMAAFAPFEPVPRLAVAVSGGADSLALALLTHDWAEARGGAVTALTVDHRLRPESAAEAAQVATWLGARGIAHRILVRDGPRPAGDLQAAARAARYALLEGWCRAAGVLHLLTAHHRADQAETLLLRLARGSGLDGLAGMPAVGERAACRVLRPFLDQPPARLRATLAAAGQPWIEDPSNRDAVFARARLRRARAVLAAEGLSERRLAATAARLARARRALEAGVAALLAEAVMLHPAGFARLDPAVLTRVPEEVGLRALAALLTTIGGAEHPPRLERLERLYRDLPAPGGGGRTLAGCRLLPRRDGILICREPAAVAPPAPAFPGQTLHWDGRFALVLLPMAPPDLTLGALGADSAEVPAALAARLPAAVRPSLPALRDGKGLVAVPHLSYERSRGDGGAAWPGSLFFRPTRPLARAGFTVA